MKQHIVRPATRLDGDVTVPGDKSISHRALMIASVGHGSCRISNLSTAADVQATRDALGALGAVIGNGQSLVEGHHESDRGFESQILVEGRGWASLRPPAGVLYCANSGTTARTLLGILAGRPFTTELDGDASLRARPMGRVVDPLAQMGARFEGDRLPLRISGGALRGITYELPVASAQVKTAIIYAGLQAEGETAVVESSPSRDHTERLLEHLGVSIDKQINRLIVKPTEIQNASAIRVPGDLSSAAFLLVAAAIVPGSEVLVRGVGVNPGRTGILDVLERFGAVVSVEDLRNESGEPSATVRVRARDRRPVRIDAAEVPAMVDELPLVGVLGAYADGETVVTGAQELRIKESDRIASIVSGLRRLGADAEALPDGFVVRGGAPLRGAPVESAGDHRIAMALAVAALGATGETTVEGWQAVPVSYPGFEDVLEGLCVR